MSTQTIPTTFLQYCIDNQKNYSIPVRERNVIIFMLRDYPDNSDYKTYIELLNNLKQKKYPRLMIQSFVSLWHRYICDIC